MFRVVSLGDLASKAPSCCSPVLDLTDREEANYWFLRRARSASQSICLPWVEAAVAIAETLLDLSSFLSFCVVML